MPAGKGRPRKPTVLRVLHGDFEKDPKRQNKREPKPKTGKPVCPKWIAGEARKEWNRICKLLSETGVLTKDTGPALEQYCSAYKLWRKALDHVEKNGIATVRTDSKGNKHIVRNPYAKEMREQAHACHKWLIEFGLTPASRTRIQITNETDTASDKAKKFLA